MSAIFTLAAKEFRDDFRNRWILACALLFALMALGIAWFGSAAAGRIGAASFDTTLASLTTLGAFVVPLIGLLMAYDTIVGERSDGTLLLLLSYPLGRGQLLIGKFLGHCAALALATVIGFGGAIITFLITQDVDTFTAGLGDTARFLLSAVLLGASFVALGCTLSVVTSDKSRAAGLALIGWFGTVVMFDLTLLALLVVSGGSAIERAVYPYLLLLNPVDAFRLLNLTALGDGSGSELLTGMTAGFHYPMTLLLAVQLAWLLLPLIVALLLFRRRDI